MGRLGDVAADPTALASLLLLLNVVAYVPFGFFATLAWERPWLAVAAAGVVSVSVEALQLALLSRAAATDDVLLNLTGAAAGAILGAALLRAGRRRPVSPS